MYLTKEELLKEIDSLTKSLCEMSEMSDYPSDEFYPHYDEMLDKVSFLKHTILPIYEEEELVTSLLHKCKRM